MKFLAATAAFFALAFVLLSAQPNPDACPSGSSNFGTTLMDYCQAPGNRIVCVLDAFGFSPVRDGVDQYVRSVPEAGPWCPNARVFESSP